MILREAGVFAIEIEIVPFKVAEYISSHNKVSKGIYAGLDEGEAGERANKYLKGGHGALCGIELKGGKASGEKFINNKGSLSADVFK